MSIKKPLNANYAATVVALKDFVVLPNCDNIKGALIFGNHVIVSKDAQVGDVGLFFPVEAQLDAEFLSNNNLYRPAATNELSANVDPTKSGFFQPHGRIKAVKFRGHKSEGFFIPLGSLSYIAKDMKVTDFVQATELGNSFDELDGHTICRKYTVPVKEQGSKSHKPKDNLETHIVFNQFRFHGETSNLRRNIHKILPETYISISDKWHGTSVVVGKVLTHKTLTWYEKLLKRLGVQVVDQMYGLVYSSRAVIKAVNGDEKRKSHYYTEDIWGIVAKEIEDRIPNGYTIYGEIVGHTPGGAQIQKGYHYGCPKGGHALRVYRVTTTNVDGRVLDLSWLQMQEFCVKSGLLPVNQIWYGQASELIENFSESAVFNCESESDWQQELLKYLEKEFANDGMCPFNNNEVPAEGVVVRIDGLDAHQAFKLKNFKFLEWETKQLDKGVIDLESAQVEAEEVAA